MKYSLNWFLTLLIVWFGVIVTHGLLNYSESWGKEPVEFLVTKPISNPGISFKEIKTESVASPPVKKTLNITAESYYVYNPETYGIKIKENINKESHIASLTKLMTAIVMLENYELDESVTVVRKPSSSEGNLGLRKGYNISVEDGLEAILVRSYNDVPVVFADAIDGGYEEFIKQMNEKAKDLGMDSTNFSNPSGLIDQDNYSTARDLQKLVDIFLQQEELVRIVNLEKTEIEYRDLYGNEISKTVYNTNRMLDYKGNVGIKTGYTGRAGECFIGEFRIEEKDYVIIVLDSKQRFTDTKLIIKELQLL